MTVTFRAAVGPVAATGPSRDQAGTKLGLSRDQAQVLEIANVPRSIQELMAPSGRTNRTKFRDQVLRPLFDAGLLELTIPDKPRSPQQRYRATAAGRALLKEIDKYDDIELLVTVTASALAEYWVIWAGGKYNQRVISGATAIQAVLVYPYFQTGQLSGFLGGLKGAAEYERSIGRDGAGVSGMDAQSMAHLLIVVLIILGNIGFLIHRRTEARAKRMGSEGVQR